MIKNTVKKTRCEQEEKIFKYCNDTEDYFEKMFGRLKKKQTYENYRYVQRLLFSSCVLINDVLYTVTNLGEIPIKIDLHNQEMTCIDKWSKDQVINSVDMLVDGNDIYLLGIDGYHMLKYNIVNQQYYKYRIDCHMNDWGNYAAYAIYKRNIYIVPKNIPKIVKVDLERNIVSSDLEYCFGIENEKEKIVFECGIQDKNLLWLFQKEGSLVMAYNMETNTWKNYILPQKIFFCIHVVLQKNIFYMLSMEGKVYSWDIQDNSMRMIADCSDETKSINSFGRIVVTNQFIYVLPTFGESIYKIDIETRKVKLFDDYPNNFQYIEPEGWSKYFGYCEDENHIYFAMRSSVYIFCINKKNGLTRWICPKISTESCFNALIIYSEEIFEEGTWNVNDLINIKVDSTKKSEEQYLVGKQIWTHLR